MSREPAPESTATLARFDVRLIVAELHCIADTLDPSAAAFLIEAAERLEASERLVLILTGGGTPPTSERFPL